MKNYEITFNVRNGLVHFKVNGVDYYQNVITSITGTSYGAQYDKLQILWNSHVKRSEINEYLRGECGVNSAATKTNITHGIQEVIKLMDFLTEEYEKIAAAHQPDGTYIVRPNKKYTKIEE